MRSWRDWSWADGNFWDSGVQPHVELFSRGFLQKQQYLIKTDQGFFTIAGKVHSVLKGTPVATHLDGDHKETILVIGTGKHARAYKLDGPVITG